MPYLRAFLTQLPRGASDTGRVSNCIPQGCVCVAPVVVNHFGSGSCIGEEQKKKTKKKKKQKQKAKVSSVVNLMQLACRMWKP